jgi:transcriptional regulator with XRE-family HTH domain
VINPAALAAARTNRGLSQRKVAVLVGINYQQIRRIEAGGDDGNLTIRDFERLCAALQVPPSELLVAPDHQGGDLSAGQEGSGDLDAPAARLLRRIQRGEDVRRSLSQTERELLLPALRRRHLVRIPGAAPPALTSTADLDLGDPESEPI